MSFDEAAVRSQHFRKNLAAGLAFFCFGAPGGTHGVVNFRWPRLYVDAGLGDFFKRIELHGFGLCDGGADVVAARRLYLSLLHRAQVGPYFCRTALRRKRWPAWSNLGT